MQNYRLPLEDGEVVKLRSPGSLSMEPLGRWRMGEWVETDRRMMFLQLHDVKFIVRFDSLVEMAPCEREYSYKIKRCLKIVFNDGGDNKAFWFLTPDAALWEDKLAEYVEDSITEDDISKVALKLGHEAEKVVWHLYRKRHATISELSTIAGAESHMDVLNMIRKEINKVSSEMIGRPILIFKPVGIDQKGQKVNYSWWFTGCKVVKESPFCDIIDEGEFYRVIIESPPNTKEELKDSLLCLKNRRGFAHAVNLPPDASMSIHNKSYRNGVLELCIMKQA